MNKKTKPQFNKLSDDSKWELYEELCSEYSSLSKELRGVKFSFRNISNNYQTLKEAEADLRIKYKRLGDNLRSVLDYTDSARVAEKQLKLRKAEVDKILGLL